VIHMADMTGNARYVVEVTVRHKDTHRTVKTWVEVFAPYEEESTALLLAAQIASTHRESFMPVMTRIVEMEA
jgi:hypothetical protein